MSELDFEQASEIAEEITEKLSRPIPVSVITNSGTAAPHTRIEVISSSFGASEITTLDEIATKHDCSVMVFPQRGQRGSRNDILEVVCEIRGVPR